MYVVSNNENGYQRVLALISYLQNAYYSLKKYVGYVLEKIKYRITILPLIQDLTNKGVKTRDRAPWINAAKDRASRINAAKALGEIKDKRAVLPLIEALNDNDEVVRNYSAEALVQIKDERAVLPLIDALKDNNKVVRYNAAWALGEIKDERAVLPLIDALKDDNEKVRTNASKALIEIAKAKPGSVNIQDVVKALQEFVEKSVDRESAKKEGVGYFTSFEAINSNREKINMEGELLPGSIKPPKGPVMYRVVGSKSPMRL